jgi:hypothetical protein
MLSKSLFMTKDPFRISSKKRRMLSKFLPRKRFLS